MDWTAMVRVGVVVRKEGERENLLVFVCLAVNYGLERGSGEVRMAEITDYGVKGRRSSGCGDSGNTIVASKELVQWVLQRCRVSGRWVVVWG